MIHHILKENLECIYCSEKDSEKWESEWNCEHHYKLFICSKCNKKNFIKVDFSGSGHDSFGELEEKLR